MASGESSSSSSSSSTAPSPTRDCFILLDIDGVMLPIRSVEEAKAAWESGDEGELGDRDVAFAFPDRCLTALNRIISGVEAGGDAQRRKCRICLSSTWRADPTAKQHILTEFQRGDAPLSSIDRLDVTTSMTNYSVRQWEVMEWVRSHDVAVRRAGPREVERTLPPLRGGGTKRRRVAANAKGGPGAADAGSAPAWSFSWVVLDDDESCVNDDRFKALVAPHSVLVDSRSGLTAEDADAAIAILLEP